MTKSAYLREVVDYLRSYVEIFRLPRYVLVEVCVLHVCYATSGAAALTVSPQPLEGHHCTQHLRITHICGTL